MLCDISSMLLPSLLLLLSLFNWRLSVLCLRNKFHDKDRDDKIKQKKLRRMKENKGKFKKIYEENFIIKAPGHLHLFTSEVRKCMLKIPLEICKNKKFCSYFYFPSALAFDKLKLT